MADHNDLGKEGEEMAAAWMVRNGYNILHRNWRYSHFEIDIIAEKGKFLHFVEVKARKHSPVGHPEDSVTKKKFKFLQQAADTFLHLNPQYKWIEFNILSITLQKNGDTEYFWIRDVFF